MINSRLVKYNHIPNLRYLEDAFSSRAAHTPIRIVVWSPFYYTCLRGDPLAQENRTAQPSSRDICHERQCCYGAISVHIGINKWRTGTPRFGPYTPNYVFERVYLFTVNFCLHQFFAFFTPFFFKKLFSKIQNLV